MHKSARAICLGVAAEGLPALKLVKDYVAKGSLDDPGILMWAAACSHLSVLLDGVESEFINIEYVYECLLLIQS